MSRREHENDYYNDEYYADEEHEQGKPPRRRTGCWILLVVLALLATCVGGIGAVILYLAGEPSEVEVEFAAGQDITLAANAAEPATFAFTIENTNVDPITLTAIGLDTELLDGVAVVATTPAFRPPEERSYPLLGGDWMEYKYDRQLGGGSKLDVELQFKGLSPGSYSGDLTIWVESDILGFSITRARHYALDITVE